VGDQPTIRLFSYGTLQLERVQLSTFGRLLHGTADAMVGYRLEPMEITDPEVIAISGTNAHTNLVLCDDPADEVEGTVFEITAAELAAADEYEVDGYERVSVRLRSGQEAFVYIAPQS
jgi:gamma-glutamylcyclotransferase (GGCT)/AIG2-like uncharacterized protein YtfP